MSILNDIEGRSFVELKLRKKISIKKTNAEALKAIEDSGVDMGAFFDYIFDKVNLPKLANEIQKEVKQDKNKNSEVNVNNRFGG